MSALDELVVELQNEIKILQANNENLKQRNSILRERPDLPVDRIPATEFLKCAEERIVDLSRRCAELQDKIDGGVRVYSWVTSDDITCANNAVIRRTPNATLIFDE